MLSDTKHAQIKHLYPNPQMIEFHIHQQFDPSWQKLAQYITTIWPKDNMCIVAQPEQIDAIIKAISTHPTRLMLCTTKPFLSGQQTKAKRGQEETVSMPVIFGT